MKTQIMSLVRDDSGASMLSVSNFPRLDLMQYFARKSATCVRPAIQPMRSTRPSACFAKRPSPRGCTGSSFGQGQPPKRVRW